MNVVVSLVLHRQMLQAAAGGTLQGWMVEAFREKVARDGVAGTVGAAGGWDRLVAGRDGGVAAGGTVDAAGGQRSSERVETPVTDSLRDFVPTGWSWNGEYHEFKTEPLEESA